MSAHRTAGAFAALAFATAMPAVAQGSLPWSQDPSSKCRFVAPQSLTAGPIYWTGACPAGKASGPGMLLRRTGGKPGHAFYGEMRAGVPVIGVIEADGGFFVGRFIDGDLGPRNTEGQETIDAFRAGARGARAVSARYAAQKNAASAQHYAAVAKKLEAQIE